MAEGSKNNKRIAKNTLLLYFRMLFLMAISLYTSRVVLDILGIEDYGIYNVVGGIVAMFSFMNSSMSASTQRYITFALGEKNSEKQQEIFNTSLIIHAIICIILLLIAETIGLWFLLHKMQIPITRLSSSFWVYQSSIVAAMVVIMSVPYNAVIIAHEKMSAFAYISVLEAVLKLLIVYLLLISPIDSLVFYSILIVLVQIIIRFCYGWYCKKHFRETSFRWCWNIKLMRKMTAFACWNLFGSCASISMTQGLNVLLNIFFGPVVNAARAVAVQVQNAIVQFVSNFQMAMNPQIIKSFASGDLDYMHGLIFRSSKFSFCLIYIISLPILIEAPMILSIWLKEVPDNAITFLRIMICVSWISALANPLINAAQASGKIRLYQSVIGTILILILPFSYFALKMGMPAYSVFIIHLIMECVAHTVRLLIVRPLIELSIKIYFKEVINVLIPIILLSLPIPLILHKSLSCNLYNFIMVCTVSIFISGCSIWLLALKSSERTTIKTFVRQKMKFK